MSIKLSDFQIAMLSVAAQRDDCCLVAPPKLKGGAAQKVASKLIDANLVREIKAKPNAPVWRRDAETGLAFSLKLTAAGLKAAAGQGDQGAIAKDKESGALASDNKETISADTTSRSPRATEGAPRDGSKLAAVISLLHRGGGATILALTDATGWLPHTTRAAITGLRKRGYAVTRARTEDGLSTYRIVDAGGESSDAEEHTKEAETGKVSSASKAQRRAA